MPAFSAWLLTALATFQVVQGAHPSVSRAARCGADFGHACVDNPFGSCCSKHGWCGTSNEHCGDGCQAGWGKCISGSTVEKRQKISDDGRCGTGCGTCEGSGFGDCCNPWGYCGSGKKFCGKGCNPLYGKCSGSESYQPASSPLAYPSSSSIPSPSSVPSPSSTPSVPSASPSLPCTTSSLAVYSPVASYPAVTAQAVSSAASSSLVSSSAISSPVVSSITPSSAASSSVASSEIVSSSVVSSELVSSSVVSSEIVSSASPTSADPSSSVVPSSSSSTSETPSPTPSAQCNLGKYPGTTDGLKPIITSNTLSSCTQLCVEDSECQFFLYSSGECYLYTKPLSYYKSLFSNISVQLYEKACFVPASASSTPVVTPSPTPEAVSTLDVSPTPVVTPTPTPDAISTPEASPTPAEVASSTPEPVISSSATPTPTPSPVPAVCGVATLPSGPGQTTAYKYTSQMNDEECAQLCLADSTCTYIIVADTSDCYLFNKPYSHNDPTVPSSAIAFYERACFDHPAPAASSSAVPSSTPEASPTPEATPTSSATPSPSPSQCVGRAEYPASSVNTLLTVYGSSSVQDCAQRCLAEPSCQFFFVYQNTFCYQYKVPLSTISSFVPQANVQLFDKSCFA